MLLTVIIGIMLPFFGTALGSSAVFAMRKNRKAAFTDCLSGFAGGVMLAASLWSLLIPAIEGSDAYGAYAFVPVSIGFSSGIAFMALCERLLEGSVLCKGGKAKNKLITALAVTVHNLPEGMAVGIAYAAVVAFSDAVSLSAALSLSLGIAIQNIPEGAIVSLPLFSDRRGRLAAFTSGVLSGAVEPLGAVLTFFFAGFFSPLMPVFLSFAAGAMIFVVINELSDEMKGKRGTVFFTLGFVVMMSLDVALG